jgi:type I restriction enzyme, S subunit
VVKRSQESGHPDARSLSVFIDQGVVPRDSRSDNFNRLGADLAKYLVVRKGDIVFNKLRTWQGGLGVSKFDGIVSPAYFVCRPRDNAEPRYLHYLLRSRVYLEELTRISKWMPPSQFDISWDDLRSLAVVLPPLQTQQAVADYLDRETAQIDALIAAKQRMVELLEERLEGSVSEATHARSVADPAHRLPDSWKLVPLKRCLRSSVYGIGEASQSEGEYAVLGMTNVSSGEIVGTPGGFVSVVDNDLLLTTGDLLFNRTNSRELVGKVGLVRALDGPTTFASYLVRLRVNKLADTQYMNYLLNAREVLGLARSMALPSIGQANLNPTRYAAMVLPIPPVDEQRHLVLRLNALSSRTTNMKRLLDRQLILLQERRQTLITAAVTGQLDIQEAA